MVAGVQIREWGDSTASTTNKTSGLIRFKNASSSSADASNPMTVPSSGRDYSFEKWLKLYLSSAPSVSVSNLKFYMASANPWTGVNLWAEKVASVDFRAPSQPTETTAIPTGGSGSVSMTNAFTYTSGGALSLSSTTYSASATNIGLFTVLVMDIQTTATQGSLTTATAVFSYDEI